jgi:hypothetical protein
MGKQARTRSSPTRVVGRVMVGGQERPYAGLGNLYGKKAEALRDGQHQATEQRRLTRAPINPLSISASQVPRVTSCESAGVVAEYPLSGMETRSMDRSAFKMGSYGAGALWCLKEREGKYITFNNLRIARQEKDGTWMAVEPGWTVTKTGPVDVRVEHAGREGVTLPFRAGMRG